MAEPYTARVQVEGDRWTARVYRGEEPGWTLASAGHTRGETIRWAVRGLMARLELGPKDRLPWRVEELPRAA